ncbi:ABC transporter substrate-binding protein [Geminicoccaceae bacterium 1502E]|nr:ABC transporter substrate-binding protein [Geminicoccaceae bacterium 1502E]
MTALRTASIASALCGASMLALSAQAATPDNALVMAWNIDAISTFDPAQIGEVVTNELILNICDSLASFDPEDEKNVLPAVARSWSASDDGRSITFELRDDLVFPSGNPVTAEDAAFSLKRVVELGFGNAATLNEYGFVKEKIDEQVVVEGPHTLTLNLDKPYPTRLILQAIAANRVANVLDKKTVLEHEQDGDLGNKYLTSNTECVGPYRLRQWNAGEVVVLEANENYGGEPAGLKRVIIRHVAEAGAQRLLLEQGDVDVARNLTAEDMRDLEQSDEIRVAKALQPQFFYMGFSEEDERLANPKVREAFRWLVDYEGLGKTVMAYDGVPRASFVQLGAFGALDEKDGQPFSLDVDKAKALLEEAGYGDGFEATLIIGTQPYASPIAQHVQQNASKAGIRLDIEQMANAQLFSRYRGRDFDTIMLGWSTGVPDAHGMASRHVYNPDNSAEAKLTMYPSWRASFYSEEYNKRVDEALFEQDEAKRAELYHQMQRDIMKDGPFAYLFQIVNTAGVRSSLDNWTWNGFRTYYDLASK